MLINLLNLEVQKSDCFITHVQVGYKFNIIIFLIRSKKCVCEKLMPYGNKTENDLELDPLTCRLIGVTYILMWISVPNLNCMGLSILHLLIAQLAGDRHTDGHTDWHVHSDIPLLFQRGDGDKKKTIIINFVIDLESTYLWGLIFNCEAVLVSCKSNMFLNKCYA